MRPRVGFAPLIQCINEFCFNMQFLASLHKQTLETNALSWKAYEYRNFHPYPTMA